MYWTMTHPQYGTWKVTREAVAKDYRKYQEEFGDEVTEADDDTITTWFDEQWSWFEVKHYGELLEKPDFDKIWQGFLSKMDGDQNCMSYDGEVVKHD
jgi:hypothetical protein